ncbi:MAG TPA: radical SAM protein [Caldisericia bacterium]|nr:radical SAM protein [Caldisericia bacterium]
MQIIYEPRGRAAEYGPLAANLYRGCSHACEYCYAPAATRRARTDFVQPSPRNVMKQFEKDVIEMEKADDQRPVFLCFTCDPYQPLDYEQKLTRRAIQILCGHGRNLTILTKGGMLSVRDFDILKQYPDQVLYGATLVFADDAEARCIEPGASPTSERIAALNIAHDLGIKTWVSFEPVYHVEDVHTMIDQTKDFVDLFKVGKLNYVKTDIDWTEFAQDVKAHLEQTGVEYYLKDDLRKLL